MVRLLPLLLLLLVGCTSSRARRDYVRTLDRQTEEAKVYRGFGTALILRGTYLSPRFRSRMAAERLRLLGPAAGDASLFLARMEDEAEAYWEVVFTAEAPIERDVPVFGRGDTGWQLRLEADGVEQPLVTVYRLRDPNPMHRALFDHVNNWNSLFTARFARTIREPARLDLHVGSGFGHTTLRWSGAQLR